MNRLLLFFCTVLLGSNYLYAQTDYSNRQQLSQRVAALQNSHPNYVKTSSLAKTLGGSDVWMITIGTGNVQEKPALAIVGGVEGKHLLGVELAIGFAENLLADAGNPQVKNLLETQTFYVFPNMSPDATEQYFASLQYERSGNARKVDYDRDGKVGEDGYDDLDNDGKITTIRVEDPTGDYILNPNEPRSLIKADRAKGQLGQFLIFSEGIDNDKDGELNEDGDEGIHFNRNSTHNYKNFLPGAGEHAVSEVENRALFDFLYDAFNVYAVMTFGPYNNLSHPVQAPARAAGSQPTASPGGRGGGMFFGSGRVTSWSATDAQANAYASDRYKELTGTKDAPRTTAPTGDFAEWAYYHYGRLSFSTPGWWVPKVAADGASGSGARAGAPGAGGSGAIEDPVADYLKWAASEGITNTFADWKAIEHPDFPGKKVEVGGVHPFVMTNPPYRMVSDIVAKHTQFVKELADMAPFIELIDVKTEKIDNGLSRVTVKVFNSGHLPTLSQVGQRSQFNKLIAVRVNTSGNQKVISGRSAQTIGTIEGRSAVELSWLIQGSGKVTIEAGSPNTGSDKVEVSL
ncbi:MAG TPA: M14 family metallopeptidase [Sphingobacteriaceae bacterium]|nr:M14 family metallopeptidase [Sphingobacteriaceae bacterium]